MTKMKGGSTIVKPRIKDLGRKEKSERNTGTVRGLRENYGRTRLSR